MREEVSQERAKVDPRPRSVMVYVVEWSSEFSDDHRLVGIFETVEQAESNVPDGRWRIYEAEVDGGTPRLIALTPGWDD